MPFHVAVLAAPLVAALFGLVIGAITLRLRGPFFVIVTLVLRGSAAADRQQLDRPDQRPDGNFRHRKAGMGDRPATRCSRRWPTIMSACCWRRCPCSSSYRFVYSNIGRAAIAVRENRFVAQSIGISPFYLGLLTFVLAAGIAGLAGGFYANYVSFVGPEVFGFSFMISMIIMVLAGGKGTLVGPVVGAVIVVLLEEYLRDFKELRFSIFGLIVMAVVLFLPRGIMGFITRRHETYPRGATGDA